GPAPFPARIPEPGRNGPQVNFWAPEARMRRSMRASVRLTNTYSKALEEFQPLRPGTPLLLYSCGPTGYSYAHIGNFRTFLMGALLRGVLERAGHQVRHVMNITDVGHMTHDHLANPPGA